MTKTKEVNITNYPNSIDTLVALLEASISHINESLIRIEKRFDKIDDSLSEIRKEMRYDFRFLITIICVLSAVMAHGFKWF